MNQLHWLIRAKRWVQNPPSERRVRLVVGVLVICLSIAGIEYFFGWPDSLTVDGLRRKP